MISHQFDVLFLEGIRFIFQPSVTVDSDRSLCIILNININNIGFYFMAPLKRCLNLYAFVFRPEPFIHQLIYYRILVPKMCIVNYNI